MPVLGLETTCDETAAAVVELGGDGRGRILANEVLSQIAQHAAYGGVVPEIAARAHVEVVDRIVARALERAGTKLADLDGVAAAAGPGVLGAVGYAEPSLRFLAGTDTVFLPGAAAGARALASGQVDRLLVGERDLAAFRSEAARLGLDAHDIAMIRGYNYSRGRWTELTVFVR